MTYLFDLEDRIPIGNLVVAGTSTIPTRLFTCTLLSKAKSSTGVKLPVFFLNFNFFAKLIGPVYSPKILSVSSISKRCISNHFSPFVNRAVSCAPFSLYGNIIYLSKENFSNFLLSPTLIARFFMLSLSLNNPFLNSEDN